MTFASSQMISLQGDALGSRFDGIGVVNGGGATSVLLKDYPEPQRSQILDLVFAPKFGASVGALLVEIPGDGNSTQGSMPSHMHARDDLDVTRGYTWWILREAKRRNPAITLSATAWSAPGWVGADPTGRVAADPGGGGGNPEFWSRDTADYYVKWLEGLRDAHGLRLDAIGCRNEKGYSDAFAKLFRRALDAAGFADVRIHAFDHFTPDKFDFVHRMADDAELRDAIAIVGAHTMNSKSAKSIPAAPEVRALAARMNKPIWNTEEHVYKRGFDCAISIVQAFNDNYIRSGATRVVNWYDIAGVYPMQPYSEEPAMLLAREPWSGHYVVREALWGYAHWGQFAEVGWRFVDGGACGDLAGGGTFVTLASPDADFSVIIETKDAAASQRVTLRVGGGLPIDRPLCVWRSDHREQFVRDADAMLAPDGTVELMLAPGSIYSISTTTGQRKGGFDNVPAPAAFPFPYREQFDGYADAAAHGHLPRYFADIAGAFELADRPDGRGRCLRQAVPAPTISWAPDWRPYTIAGDEAWADYEVAADVWLTPGDVAGVMGRVNHVGTGYGFVPKGYYFELADDGRARLVVSRGKRDKKAAVGDVEQQAMIAASRDAGEGGERVLAETIVDGIAAGRWHRLALRMRGDAIVGLVDGREVVTATDALYPRGMAGLIVGQTADRVSRPYFADVAIGPPGANVPAATRDARPPLYAPAPATRLFANLLAGRPQTVVVYGTSLTHAAAWPEAMRASFERAFPGLVTFVNAAMSGQQSRWGLAELPARVLAHRPDLVLIEFSINDAATKHGISVEQSIANLDAMVRSLRAANPDVEIVLQTMNGAWDWPDDPHGKRAASDRPAIDAYYEAYRAYAASARLPLIDHHAAWERLRRVDEAQFRAWLPDGTHPTPEASLAVTWPAIEATLAVGRREASATRGR